MLLQKLHFNCDVNDLILSYNYIYLIAYLDDNLFKPFLFFIFLVKCFFLFFGVCFCHFSSRSGISVCGVFCQPVPNWRISMNLTERKVHSTLNVQPFYRRCYGKSPFNPPTPQSVEFSWKFLIQHSWRMFYPYKMCAAMFMPLKGCFWNHPLVVPAKKCVVPKELCIKTSKIIVPVIFLLKIFTDIFSYKLCYI